MADMIKLSTWAEQHGINYQTAYRWYKAGKLPAKNIIKTPTGTILVEELVPEHDDSVEADMTNESLPLSKRLSSAYKFIQSQQNSKSPEDLIDEKIGKEIEQETGFKKEDISCHEKNKLLKNLTQNAPEYNSKHIDGYKFPKDIQELIDKRNKLFESPTENSINEINNLGEIILQKKKEYVKQHRIDIVQNKQIQLTEDFSLLKDDVSNLMSNVFGDETTLMDRIRSRTIHEVNQALKCIFDNANTFEDAKKNYKEYANAVLFRKE